MSESAKEKNILLRIQYDGSDFHGWQKQPGLRTVQGEIEHALRYLAGEEIPIQGTSRTDSGVHALEQGASFHWRSTLPTEQLATVLNRRFGTAGTGRSGAPGDIRILEAREVPEDFHARYSCIGKTYRYVVDGSGDIFRRRLAYLLSAPLDIPAMRAAAELVPGTRDFRSFESAGGIPRATTVRTVTACSVEQEGERMILRVGGDGFLYHMVRNLAGTLIEIGLGKRPPESMAETLQACDRARAGFTAPPQGLYLERIDWKGLDAGQGGEA